MGVNDGVLNEKALIGALNDKAVSDLSQNLKKFVKVLFPKCSDNGMVKCSKQGGNAKGDLQFVMSTGKKSVSVKVGINLSLHEENFYTFRTEFLDTHNCPPEVADVLERFIVELGKDYKERITPEEKELVQDFLLRNKQSLLERFVKNGREQTPAEYIYYGNCNKGNCVEIDEAIRKFSSSKSTGFFQIGGISLQAYCRECGGKTKEQSQRLQAKLGESARKELSKNPIPYEECDDCP